MDSDWKETFLDAEAHAYDSSDDSDDSDYDPSDSENDPGLVLMNYDTAPTTSLQVYLE